MTKRDLEFFQNNPNEVPTDIDALHAALLAGGDVNEGGGEGEGGTTVNQDEPGATSGAASGEKSASESGKPGEQVAAAPATSAQAPAEQPSVVARDGVSKIPYSVLEGERARRQAAEQAAADLQRQIESLTAQANGTQAAAPAAAPAAQEMSEQDIAEIEKDFPAAGKALRAMHAQIGHLQQQLGNVRELEDQRQAREANSASTTVQEAIDKNATLTYWQQKDPEMFAAAVRFDNQIKADPRNRGLSLDERFEKVVRATEAVYGQAELPADFRREPAAAPAASPATAPAQRAAAPAPQAQSQKTVAARAEEAIAEAENAAPRVASLSDIPGGVPPEADEMTQMGMRSAQDLGNLFMTMDPAKLSALLAKAA